MFFNPVSPIQQSARSAQQAQSITSMARWSVVMNASLADHGVTVFNIGNLLVFLSTLLVFSVCVTMLLALCAAHSQSLNVLNARRDYSSSEAEACESSLAIAPPEGFKKQALSFRFSSPSASAAINKLGSSFRFSSSRDSSGSFRISSFRMSSFRVDSCKQVDGVVDSLRRVRPAGLEEEGKEPAVWQRAILRGERCAPLSFSGLILYDEKGNQLPSFSEETKEPDLHNSQPTMGGVRAPRLGSTSGNELERGFETSS